MTERQSRIEPNPENISLSGQETAELWRVSADLVRKYIATGKLAALHIVPGVWEVKRSGAEVFERAGGLNA
jgi:hypothetical protein